VKPTAESSNAGKHKDLQPAQADSRRSLNSMTHRQVTKNRLLW